MRVYFRLWLEQVTQPLDHSVAAMTCETMKWRWLVSTYFDKLLTHRQWNFDAWWTCVIIKYTLGGGEGTCPCQGSLAMTCGSLWTTTSYMLNNSRKPAIASCFAYRAVRGSLALCGDGVTVNNYEPCAFGNAARCYVLRPDEVLCYGIF